MTNWNPTVTVTKEGRQAIRAHFPNLRKSPQPRFKMRIKPLPGQVLVQVETPTESSGGVALPGDIHLSAEIIQDQAKDPQKPSKDNTGYVVAIGAWPKTSKGLIKMPEFGIGARVVFNPFRGLAMVSRGRRLKILSQDDVMGVLG